MLDGESIEQKDEQQKEIRGKLTKEVANPNGGGVGEKEICGPKCFDERKMCIRDRLQVFYGKRNGRRLR